MTESGFEKIQQSDKCFFGPRKLMLTGFTAEAQAKFRILMEMLGFDDLALVWMGPDQMDDTLEDLSKLPDGHGQGVASPLPRVVIVGGIAQKELHALMNGCRRTGMQQTLWATLTPTSVTWPLRRLLVELAAEHKAMTGRTPKSSKG